MDTATVKYKFISYCLLMQISMEMTAACSVSHVMICWATSHAIAMERECAWKDIRIQTATALSVDLLKDAVCVSLHKKCFCSSLCALHAICK